MTPDTLLSTLEGTPSELTDQPFELIRVLLRCWEQHPDRVAVQMDEESLTARELLSRASRACTLLRTRGMAAGSRVGILSEPSIEAIIGILSILMGGAAYVPLNPEQPLERTSFMLQDAGVSLVLTRSDLSAVVRQAGGHPIVLAEESKSMSHHSDTFESAAQPDSTAYVMYTSGSTGRPKGVPIRHESVVNLLISLGETLRVTPQDLWLSVTALTFDISVLELFLPWSQGAPVRLISREVARSGRLLRDTIERYQPTIMQATPASWSLLLHANWRGSPGLKILTGGEALSNKLAAELLPRGCELWNLYGPTETTIWSSACQVTCADGSISLGLPVRETTLYVLDERQRVLPIGSAGELCIGGIGLASGYLNRPELTSEKFIETDALGRLYRTGDRVRMLCNGTVEYLGRLDFQVKLRGYRIELGEIESLLGTHPAVRQTVVVLNTDLEQLVAYWLGDAIEPKLLRAYLLERLPEHMVPTTYVQLEEFPLNPSGKVDRKALPDPCATVVASAVGGPDIQGLSRDWMEVLELVRAPRDDDDFFSLGGSSLRAAKLIRRVERWVGCEVPLDVIFEERTLARQAARLRAIKEASRTPIPSVLMPMQTLGKGRPLYLLHTFTGSLSHDLAALLAPDVPVVGLRALPAQICPETIEGIASVMLAQIQSSDPDGPLLLTGYSFGGLLALEIAQQARRAGREVALLAVIDTDLRPVAPSLSRQLIWRAAEKLFALALGAGLNSSRLRAFVDRQQLRRGHLGALSDYQITQVLRSMHGFDDMPDHNRAAAIRHFRAEELYRPAFYRDEILLLRRRPSLLPDNPTLGWNAISRGPLTVEYLKARHHRLLTEPMYPVLAQTLRSHVQRVQREI